MKCVETWEMKFLLPRYGGPKTQTDCQDLSTLLVQTDEASSHYIHLPGQKTTSAASLVVHWLRFQAPSVGDPGLIPGQGTRPHMPQLRVRMRPLKILHAKQM